MNITWNNAPEAAVVVVKKPEENGELSFYDILTEKMEVQKPWKQTV